MQHIDEEGNIKNIIFVDKNNTCKNTNLWISRKNSAEPLVKSG